MSVLQGTSFENIMNDENLETNWFNRPIPYKNYLQNMKDT